MELWKIHKFCESASLAELRDRLDRLKLLVESRKLSDTNAEKVLALLNEYIELKSLFEDE